MKDRIVSSIEGFVYADVEDNKLMVLESIVVEGDEETLFEVNEFLSSIGKSYEDLEFGGIEQGIMFVGQAYRKAVLDVA